MAQSKFSYTYGRGTLRGTKHEIGVRHDPDINNVESFAAILFFSLSDGRRVEIVKIDDSDHDGVDDIHIDRYYREIGADIKDFDRDAEIHGWEGAEAYLNENWEWFANKYFENHGQTPRSDGANIGAN